jgi:hypothetical protein
MVYCKNCGYESHCGVPLMKEFRGQGGIGGIEGQVEVCKKCRCEKCKKDMPLIAQEWR